MPGASTSSIDRVTQDLNMSVDLIKGRMDIECLPEQFRNIAKVATRHCELGATTLELRIAQQSAQNLEGVAQRVESCQNKAKRLHRLLQWCLDADDASIYSRYVQRVRTLGKDERLEALVLDILRNIQQVARQTQAEDDIERLDEAIVELSAAGESVPDEKTAPATIQSAHYGAGSQNIHTGTGQQAVHNGSGQMYLGTTTVNHGVVNYYSKDSNFDSTLPMRPRTTTPDRSKNAKAKGLEGAASSVTSAAAQPPPMDPINEGFRMAATHGSLRRLQYYFLEGASVNSVNKYNMTPLHEAASFGHESVVRFLVEHGANINAIGGDNMSTPLHHAALFGRVAIVQYLLDRGADMQLMSPNKGTALHAATNNNQVGVVELLLNKGAGIESTDFYGWRPLHVAAYVGHWRLVRLFLDMGADIKATCQAHYANTALHKAAQAGRNDVVRYLLAHGADVDETNGEGWTALHMAAGRGHLETIRVLLNRRRLPERTAADTHAVTEMGLTALHIAARFNRHEVVGYLIDNIGLSKRATSNNGWTPLHIAANFGHMETVELLLSKGARTSPKTSLAQTAMRLAQNEGHDEIADLLQATYLARVQSHKENAKRASLASTAGSETTEKLTELKEEEEEEEEEEAGVGSSTVTTASSQPGERSV